MDGESLALREVVGRRPQRVGEREHPLLGEPQSHLLPARAPHGGDDLERRARHSAEGHAMVGHAETLRNGEAVALVPVEELDDAGRIAERTDARLDALSVDRIDEPDSAAGANRMRGAQHVGGLGGDPAEPELRLVGEADVHTLGASLASVAVCERDTI